MATNVLETVYETLLCSPGMNEAVKIDAKISRKTILLLDAVIRNAAEGNVSGLLEFVSEDSKNELRQFADECLKKAGLTELSDKVKALSSKN